jgi:stearoyl-CoA desaturase (delta-9 desaturase)
MNLILGSVAIFGFGYFLNIFYITVLYHRGLAHGSVELNPLTRKWVVASGSWVTGIDPKAWACMHRLHHKYSDTDKDPHSPMNHGIFGVMLDQLTSYKKALVGLSRGRKEYVEMVQDLDFPINILNRKKLWLAPYLLHALIAIACGLVLRSWIPGLAYWIGIMSHPVQGWLVN